MSVHRLRILLAAAVMTIAATSIIAQAGSHKVYTTYLWHLQQPNYWPEKVAWGDRYMFAYEHLGGSPSYPGHPENNLAEIFGKDDRTAVYQYRARDTVSSILYTPDGGAQLSYSGCLIENINSLGQNYSTGYNPDWNAAIREGVRWTTSRGKRRLEPLGFAYHHALMPLVDRDARRKEIALNKHIWWKAWLGHDYTPDQPHPKGFRCSEESFSTRIIKELVEAGYEWVIVPNHHLSRTHPNYEQRHGKGLYDPPNRADQINPPNSGGWYSGEIDGRGSTESVPFSFQAHRAKYVDPESGTEYRIIVVPMTDLGSYRDGYSQQGIDILHTLNANATYSQPCIAMFSHDGDNAWGGGFSYYGEAVPSFVGSAQGAGYRPTTIQTFLDENPPPENDIVHVEDGSWFNAADDWGHPQFWNWLWYPQRDRNSPGYDYSDPTTYADIPNGWSEDFRNWAVIMAAQNYVSTAEQIHRTRGWRFEDWRVQDPVAGEANNAELAWHFFLPALASCYMYYGTALDMEVKPTLACNKAVEYANAVIAGNLEGETTPPTVFIPQRYPYNPGSRNYGSAYGYREWIAPSDFYVWTLAHDASGLTSVTLKIRADLDGVNPLGNNDNETYAGGATVGAWQSYPMNNRPGNSFAGNIFNDPTVNFFIMPTVIADEYWFNVTGYNNQLLDYYIEAVDTRGNVKKTDIQHVFVGSEIGGSSVSFSPPVPDQCDSLVTTYVPGSGPLAGETPIYVTITYDGWSSARTNQMTDVGGVWQHASAIPPAATNAVVNFRNGGSSVVDDNGGLNWSVAIAECQSNVPPDVMVSPAAPDGCDDVTITYRPGSGPLQNASNVFIHVGRNSWQDVVTPDPPMLPGSNGWTYVHTLATGTVEINFVFNDGKGVWDNNAGQDWSVVVENCAGGVQGVWFAEGSPAVTMDPPDPAHQNNAGADAFDLAQSGGDAVTVGQGGFGSFGHVYLNYDATHLSIGGVDATVGGSNNAMIVFLALNTLSDDATNLWHLNGLPNGLDALHNVIFTPPMDVAILLGDEFGDGTCTNFSLGNGYDFGQGVFYLSRFGTFSGVAGASLSQFDGHSTDTVSGDDDDGDRLTERWECRIPWTSLSATGMADITSCHIAGLLVNSSTNGVDRYISGNYLGETASGDVERDEHGNFAFGLVTISGIAVGHPGQDSDGDGLLDRWELRYYGGVTNAAPSADDDRDGFTNDQEQRLGTNLRSAASTFEITSASVTGTMAVVSWVTVGKRTYTVDASTNLMLPSGGFTPVHEVTEADVPDGIGAAEMFADPAASNAVSRYYRVRLK